MRASIEGVSAARRTLITVVTPAPAPLVCERRVELLFQLNNETGVYSGALWTRKREKSFLPFREAAENKALGLRWRRPAVPTTLCANDETPTFLAGLTTPSRVTTNPDRKNEFKSYNGNYTFCFIKCSLSHTRRSCQRPTSCSSILDNLMGASMDIHPLHKNC
ncbi:hypothetical protein EVAR_57761_1 [Eumeta japonica]|uniref:Uncharacterized protein n=1 Tax=Eumeta variegata TaxID=151549 RepID=A0A4C1Y7W2_EUMVA|nr:hypothetical protein EVAR_57761_1 [Eumeta japonica]